MYHVKFDRKICFEPSTKSLNRWATEKVWGKATLFIISLTLNSSAQKNHFPLSENPHFWRRCHWFSARRYRDTSIHQISWSWLVSVADLRKLNIEIVFGDARTSSFSITSTTMTTTMTKKNLAIEFFCCCCWYN